MPEQIELIMYKNVMEQLKELEEELKFIEILALLADFTGLLIILKVMGII